MFGAAKQFFDHPKAVSRQASAAELENIKQRVANDVTNSYGEGDWAQGLEQPLSPEQVYQQIEGDLKEVGAQYHQLDQLRSGIQKNLDDWSAFIDRELGEGKNIFIYSQQIAQVKSQLDETQKRLNELGKKYYELTEEIEPFDQLKQNDQELVQQASEGVATQEEISQTVTAIQQFKYAWEQTVQQRNQTLEQTRAWQQRLTQLHANARQQEGWDEEAKQQIQLYRPYAEHPEYRHRMLSNGMTYLQMVQHYEAYRSQMGSVINQTRAHLIQSEEQYTSEYRKYTSLDQQQAQIADQFLQAQTRLSQLYEKQHAIQMQGYQTKFDRPKQHARVQGVVQMRQSRRQSSDSSIPAQYR